MFKFLSNLFGRSRKDTDRQIVESIERFKNRPIHKKLTVEILDATPEDDLLQVIFDHLSEKIPPAPAREYETVMGWTRSQQAIYLIWCLEADVNNGGFNQYYANPSGVYASLTPDALRLVGAMKCADLVARANVLYEAHSDEITAQQDGTLEGFSRSYVDNPLNALDNEFYAIGEMEDLQRLQIDYIKKHVEDFIFSRG